MKDSNGSNFFGDKVSLDSTLHNLLETLNLPSDHKFPLLTETNKLGLISAYPGSINNSKEKNVYEISTMLKDNKSFYCYEEYFITTESWNKLVKFYNLPRDGSFFNDNSMVTTKVAFFFSNGNVVTNLHKDPSSGFLVMVCGGVTRVCFPDDSKHTTLAAIGDMVLIKHGVRHQVYSKGPRVCLSFFSLTEQDYQYKRKKKLKK